MTIEQVCDLSTDTELLIDGHTEIFRPTHLHVTAAGQLLLAVVNESGEKLTLPISQIQLKDQVS